MTLTYHINEINDVAQKLLDHAIYDTFIFNAAMGAGKTTLITALCKQLGVTEEMSSPTFSIVNEYRTAATTLFHFDLYRIEQEEELLDIGIEDYLDQKALLFFEWPALVLPYLNEYVIVTIEVIDEQTRLLTVSNYNGKNH